MGAKGAISYTQVLQDVHACLEKLVAQTKPLGDSPPALLLLQRMDQQDKRQEEILALLKAVNGTVDEHGTTLARHGQWIDDHVTATHVPLEKEVEYVKTRTNVIGVIDAVLAFVAGILGLANFK